MKDLKSELFIGAEVHIELTTKSKMFCGCPADHFGKDPNTQTCPVCLGLPGALPVPNQRAIEDTLKIGLALNCEINQRSHFDRKQYFYPDLSKGYQISQYDQPFCHDGFVILDSGKKIRIERVHLEEDTGKLQHDTLPSLPVIPSEVEGSISERVSLIDFNRSGVPLVEIVSYPDLSSSDEAKEYLKKIHNLVRELKVSDADMEKGQMRLEPTVNLKITDGKGDHYTPLVELKNINSFSFAAAAINYEAKRQLDEWQKTVIEKSKSNKATRGYDSQKKVTFPQRQKEEAKDYRYFPEPDIPPLHFSSEYLKKIKESLPKLPEEIKRELIDLGIDAKYAEIIHKDKIMLSLIQTYKSDPEIKINNLANLLVNKKIDPSTDIKKSYLSLNRSGETDETKIKEIIEQVLKANPAAAADYRKGKTNTLGFLVGQVMRQTKGEVDPKTANTLLALELSKL